MLTYLLGATIQPTATKDPGLKEVQLFAQGHKLSGSRAGILSQAFGLNTFNLSEHLFIYMGVTF